MPAPKATTSAAIHTGAPVRTRCIETLSPVHSLKVFCRIPDPAGFSRWSGQPVYSGLQCARSKAVIKVANDASHVVQQDRSRHGQLHRHDTGSRKFRASLAGLGGDTAVRPFRCYDLRHGFAVRALQNGWDSCALSKQLVHSNVKTPDIYLGYVPDRDSTKTGTDITVRQEFQISATAKAAH
ncbi:hypothetical protein CRT60_14980 [Azospirillum palustre]|uniref:Tyr recombinase domain-containing protein n=1 Tax=Azospirillum palustre TaxID=2044885 RepID=A0A2B8BFV9_9PROT|nr:hypothetical protein CRT60_14980 [Azospirillum palustre]